MSLQPPGGGAVVLSDTDRAAAIADLRSYLHAASAEDDVVLGNMVEAALALAEAFLGTALIVRECSDVLMARSDWQPLSRAPVSAVTGVAGLPAEGAAFTLATDSYAIDIDSQGSGWVRVVAPGSAGRIAVTYQAGLVGQWDAIPQPVRQGIVMLAAHLREQDTASTPPAAVTALWRPFRRLALTGQVHA